LSGLSASRWRTRTVKLRLGTRGSRLALAQAHALSAQLVALGHEPEIVAIKTSGDRGNREVLGAFVKEIQVALLQNEVDVALHCLKDLPTTPVPGLALSAYLEREDARDTLISRGPELKSLPEGSVIGTGSLRRTSQIARVRPDVTFKPLVGNVDTRMRKLMDGEYDAIVLAIAGLKRLGVLDTWAESDYRDLTVWPKATETIVPAPGQAILVLETRADDADAIAAVAPLHHEPTSAAGRAERAFLATFGGGCSVPVGAFAKETEHGLSLLGCVASPDGKRHSQGHNLAEGRSPEEQGRALADTLDAYDIVASVLRDRDGGGQH
jgi:hydroxymethylbilane synthase